jgi:ABC-2 type transport system permease protein
MELQQYNLFFLYQETFALTKRLFIQLKRRPSTLLAGILQPIIWLFYLGHYSLKRLKVFYQELILMVIF